MVKQLSRNCLSEVIGALPASFDVSCGEDGREHGGADAREPDCAQVNRTFSLDMSRIFRNALPSVADRANLQPSARVETPPSNRQSQDVLSPANHYSPVPGEHVVCLEDDTQRRLFLRCNLTLAHLVASFRPARISCRETAPADASDAQLRNGAVFQHHLPFQGTHQCKHSFVRFSRLVISPLFGCISASSPFHVGHMLCMLPKQCRCRQALAG